jgi:hypothetical protein
MTDVPIACTLSPDGFQARMSLIDALGVDGLVDRAPIENGVRVRLRDTPDIEQRTLELVAAESRCCPFLGFDLRRQDGGLVLDISGPEDAQPVIELFFEPEHLDRVRLDQRRAGSGSATGTTTSAASSAVRSGYSVRTSA